MSGLSLTHVVIVLLIVLIFFGAGKLPNVMQDLGKGVKAFKEGMEGADKKPARRKTKTKKRK
jgi:sec-independent protein translocase protein TatA